MEDINSKGFYSLTSAPVRNVFLLFFLFFLFAGCSQNRIHRLHDQKGADTAILMISGGLRIYKVDGESAPILGGGNILRIWEYPDVLELFPGEHKIEVSFKGGLLDSQPLTALSLNAKPDHTYIIGTIIYVSRKSKRKSWRAVIVDKGIGYSGGCSAEPIYKSVK